MTRFARKVVQTNAFRCIRAICFRGLDRILAAHMILSALARWSAMVPA